MRLGKILKGLWRWVGHISNAQWLGGIVFPAGIVALSAGLFFDFFTNEPLTLTIPVALACGCMIAIVAIGVAMWRNERRVIAEHRIPVVKRQNHRAELIAASLDRKERRILSFLGSGFETLEERRDRELEAKRLERITQAELDRENQLAQQKQRRVMIADGRDIVHRYREAKMPESFGTFLSKDRAFFDIQPRLSNEYYKGVLGRAELEGVQDEAPRRDYEAAMFLREIARLEKEWGL